MASRLRGPASQLSAATRRPAPTQPPSKEPASSASNADGNINVVVRCRGRSAGEIRDSATLVASAAGTRGTSVTLTNPSTTLSTLVSATAVPVTKTYNFGERLETGKNPLGNVFGPDADQGMLYNDVAKPILHQVLQGYNCTIFAYGQTGTGKTYTMEGDLSPYHGTFSPSAGIIPRTLYSLFEKLAEDRSEFSVRCSFVELYNEELRDLNASEYVEPSSGPQPMDSKHGSTAAAAKEGGLRIYEDKSAGSGVLIQGLEETLIRNAEEGIKVLKRGSERRQIGATKCNEQSSRSHSIFTIMVHIKETSKVGGEDLLKVGKLNLVDLAGSENVGRSGAEKGRAREAGMINASLLALGRVINKLVEKEKHIPYRESKLTRLLQDSLGGRTKTTIIATISPVNFEETISTLDYALRAKSIQNRPEINQRMTKGALLGQYATEIERLKMDLLAAREKNGIFFSSDSWAELNAEQEARRLQLEDAKRQIDINDSQLQTTRAQFEMNLRLLGTREVELRRIGDEVARQSNELVGLAKELVETQGDLRGEMVLREAFEQSRGAWKGAAGDAFQDVEGLRNKLVRKAFVESSNATVISNASSTFTSTTSDLSIRINKFQSLQASFTERVSSLLGGFSERETQNLEENCSLIDNRLAQLEASTLAIFAATNSASEHGATFVNLVETTREELLASVMELATEAKSQQAVQVKAILDGLAGHAVQTSETIEALVAPVRQLHAESQVILDSDAQRLALLQETDRQSLVDENARLREVIQQLTDSLEEQKRSTIEEDESVLAFISAKLLARSNSHLQKLEKNYNLVRTNLETSTIMHERDVEMRRGQLDELERSNKGARELSEIKTREVRDVAEETAQALVRSLGKVRTNVQGYQKSVQASAQEQASVVYNSATRFSTGEATFRTDASTSRAMFDSTFTHLVDTTRDTYSMCQQSVLEVGEEIRGTSTSAIDLVSTHAAASSAFVQRSLESLNDLRATIQTSLESDIQQDLPTGTTPRKRDWPKDSLAHLVDLDGDRQGVRQVLLRAKFGGTGGAEEEEESGVKVLGVVDTNVVRLGRSTRSTK